MKEYLPLIILFITVFVCIPILQKCLDRFLPKQENPRLPYHTKYILTNSEYKFYLALKSIMDAHSYIICPKVGFKDLFEVNAGTKDRMKHFGRISQKHIDFLICDANLKPLFGIELDDKSHNRSQVKEKDQFKDDVFKSAGFPLYRIPTTSSYSEEYIKKYITFDAPEKPEE